MAANNRPSSAALRALTAAALALPGVAAKAEEQPEFSVDIGHYSEGKRDLGSQSYDSLKLKPIRDDSIAVRGKTPLGGGWSAGLTYSQDSWSGATPVVSLPNAAVEAQIIAGASSPNSYYVDNAGNPVVVDFDSYDPDTNTYQFHEVPGLVHIMASASPETRRQWDGFVNREWAGGEVKLGGGISSEHDYLSRFGKISGKFYFDNKLTTLNWGASATFDNIRASLAANSAADEGYYEDRIRDYHGQPTIFGKRHDLAANVGLTRILNAGALVQFDLGFTHSAGFLENPYKAVILAFDDPDGYVDPSGFRYIAIKGTLEQRPDVRNQFAANLRFAQHLRGDGAIHAGYRFYHDSWGIDAHTIDLSLDQPFGNGWMVTPSARYYSQSKARFYAPFFVFNQPFPAHPGGPLDHDAIPLKYFSSDHRLSAFGALSAGFAVQKELGRGVTLDISGEHYWHRGNLKLGGGGEQSFADFDYNLVTAGLSLDLAKHADELTNSDGGILRGGKTSLWSPSHLALPVTPEEAGMVVISARYSGESRKGRFYEGHHALDPLDATTAGCGADGCVVIRVESGGHDVALDFSYALTPSIALLVEPHYVDRRASLVHPELLKGGMPPLGGGPDPAGQHATKGFGDTRLAGVAAGHWGNFEGRAMLGVSVPTGKAGIKQNGQTDFVPYSSQTGSGTWDLVPSASLAYEGTTFLVGAEVDGVKRLEAHNKEGYRLGDRVDMSGWLGAKPLPWLIASASLTYSNIGHIHGEYRQHFEKDVPFVETVQADFDVNGDGVVDSNDTYETVVYRDADVPHHLFSPLDDPANSGGAELVGGLGVTVKPTSGPWLGDSISIEYKIPVSQHWNGVQQREHPMLMGRVSVAI